MNQTITQHTLHYLALLLTEKKENTDADTDAEVQRPLVKDIVIDPPQFRLSLH